MKWLVRQLYTGTVNMRRLSKLVSLSGSDTAGRLAKTAMIKPSQRSVLLEARCAERKGESLLSKTFQRKCYKCLNILWIFKKLTDLQLWKFVFQNWKFKNSLRVQLFKSLYLRNFGITTSREHQNWTTKKIKFPKSLKFKKEL